MIQLRLLLIVLGMLLAQNSYCQYQDSLPLKELNREFLKGLQARERVVILKKVIHTDSIQLSIYKDSLLPNMRKSLDTSRKEITRLNLHIQKREGIIKGYRYCSVGMLCVILGLLF